MNQAKEIFLHKGTGCRILALVCLIAACIACNVTVYDGLFQVDSTEGLSVTGITPNSGIEPDTVAVTEIAGTNFRDGATVRLTRAGYADIAATDVVVVSGSRITCVISLAGAMFGQWNVVVTNPDAQSGTLANGFTLSWQSPTVTGITPSTGLVPNAVAITDLSGTNFRPGATVRFTKAGLPDMVPSAVAVASAARITCSVNLSGINSGPWNVVVTNPDAQSATLAGGFAVQSFMGGAFQGLPLSYSTNMKCMGGQGGFNNDEYGEGIGGRECDIAGYSKFYDPSSITTDGTYLYIIDSGNFLVRMIQIATRQSYSFAGLLGMQGMNDGPGETASFFYPRYVTYDGNGSLYLTDQHTIRRVRTSPPFMVTTVAGQFNNPGSNDGIGLAARFSSPQGITTDGTNLYIADSGNNTIRRMNLASGEVTTIAGTAGVPSTVDGTGTGALFESIMGMTTDGVHLYITQTWVGDGNIRRLTLASYEVITFATGLHMPIGITCDGTNLFVLGWEGGFWQVVLATGQVIPLAGGTWNNMGITYDGNSLYTASMHVNRIDKLW